MVWSCALCAELVYALTCISPELLQDTNRVVKETKDDMDKNTANIQGTLKTIKDDQLVEKIGKWLDAPDSSRNYNDAHDKRQENTCSWFLEGPRFRELQENAGFLWIKGTAGCGKTVLCSSIIDKIIELHRENKSVHYAYFFFDGRDSQENLQRHDKLIRALIWQLALQCDGLPAVLVELYGHGHQQPFTRSLEDTLHHIIAGLHSVYIIIDSLDECTEWDKVLRWIKRITSLSIRNLHLVVASRPEREIRDTLQSLDTRCVDLVDEAANNDITTYLEQELSLVKWDEETRMIIESTLTKGAQGMFRWVALQLMELKKCSNQRSLMNQLENLPKGLYETYDRILSKINDTTDSGIDTKTFLRWLCFSLRPLKLVEIAETVMVDLNTVNGPQYAPAHKYWDPQDVLEKCAGLIAEFGEGNVKLAHFSIKEYLLSEHLHGTASQFHLTSSELSHSLIARTCLAYLLHFDKIDRWDNVDTQFPLAPYAARYWISHARSGDIDKLEQPFTTVTLAEQLFTPNKNAWFNWVRLWDLDNPFRFRQDWSRADSTLYYAASAGLEQLSLRLLEKGADVNAQGGYYGYVLQAASYHGHEAIVKLLLEKGANVNAQGGLHGNALQAALNHGHEAIVMLLLEMGADINARGGTYGNALQQASACGHNSIVKLLVEKGADVDAQGDNALHVASRWGHEQTVQLLLEMGVDINMQGGFYGSALQAASAGGHNGMVKLLVEKGVDVNAQGGRNGNALQAASLNGHEQTVTLLLEMGADINAQGGFYGSALQAASAGGHNGIVKLLLEKGADVDAQGDNALHVASRWGHEQTVQLLLEMGVDINMQGGFYGSALQAASAGGHNGMVKLLVEKGADVNKQGGMFGNALQAASLNGHEQTVTLLLEMGADINAQGGFYGSALQAASAGGHNGMVKLLVEKGADVNKQGGMFGNALQAASLNGHEQTVTLLLEMGADINAQGGFYGSALQAASAGGHNGMVKLLVEKGADVNKQGGMFGNALQAASNEGHEQTVKLLLEIGADINAQGGHHDSALQAASANGHEGTVKLLLEKGADVNAQGGEHNNALQAASEEKHQQIVDLLLQNGAIATTAS